MAQLTTARLLLRDWREADLAPFAAMNADPEVMRYPPLTRLSRQESDGQAAGYEAMIARQGWGPWAVEVVHGPPFIGFVGMTLARFDAHFTPAVEIGWRLARPHWGNGYATEGAAAALTFGFDHLGCDEIVSFTWPANERSCGVMRRLGMLHDEADDFDHPEVTDCCLRRRVLFRISREAWGARPLAIDTPGSAA
jgi:ribosomal-protein-alanine N-acetyltransferase